jgi:hypothetical protein
LGRELGLAGYQPPIPAAPAQQQQQNPQPQAPTPAPTPAPAPEPLDMDAWRKKYPVPEAPAAPAPAPAPAAPAAPSMQALMQPQDPGAGWNAVGGTELNPNLGRGQAPQRPALRALASMGQAY